MKAVILTEGSTEKGFGHITRCSALVEAFRAASVNCTLVIDGDASVKQVLKGQSAILGDWIHNKKIRAAVLQNCDCVIIDSYHAPLSLYEEINARVPLLVCIDDYDRIHYPQRSIVLKIEWHLTFGHNPFFIDHPLNKPTIWYELLLRKEFTKKISRKIKNQITDVLITIGATDVRTYTPKVLDILCNLYPAWTKHVILGPGFRAQNKLGISKISKQFKKVNLYQNISVGKLFNLMLKSDIAITGAGQTLNELARVGLPSIGIIVADNQKLNARAWERRGAMYPIDGLLVTKNTFINNFQHILLKMQDTNLRKKMSAAGQKLVDGKGAQRVVQEIIKVLKK